MVELIVGILACSDGAAPQAPAVVADPASPDLVLVLVSNLRADAEGATGAEAAVLDGLGRTPTIRHRAAYAQSPDGFASLGSLFTGRYTSAAPLCALDPAVVSSAPPWCATLPAERYTLAEVLALYGYHTALFSSGTGGIAERVARGHAHVAEVPSPPDDAVATDWAAMDASVDAWWSATPSPRLLTIVVSDLALLRRPSTEKELLASGALSPAGVEEGAASAEALYLREAGRVGQGLAEVLPQKAWTFLAGINGLSLVESSGFNGPTMPFESRVLLDRLVHVPLAVYAPASEAAPRSWDEPVELRDVFPTLARIAGATVPDGVDGADLLAPSSDPDAVAYTELGDMIALRRGDHLLTMRTYSHHGCALDPALTDSLRDLRLDPLHFSLYDVRRDPMQTRNLLPNQPALATDLRARMYTMRTTVAAPPVEATTPERVWDYRLSAQQGYW